MMYWLGLFMIMFTIFPQQSFSGDDDYFLEIFVDNVTPFVGEQIAYHLRYYGETQTGVFPQFPSFEGFWIGDSYEAFNQIQIIGERQFFVREVVILIAPLRDGEYTIMPASLVVTGDVFRSAQVYETNPLQLQVRPLPPDAPTSFLGAVGDFTMSANFDPSVSLTLGTPFTFEIIIQGTGILELVTPPHLNLPDSWQIIAQPAIYTAPSIGIPLGSKRFRWRIIVDEAGRQTIPPIIWSYFDPYRQMYITLDTPIFSFNVLPSPSNEIRLNTTYQTDYLRLKPIEPASQIVIGDWWHLGWLIMPSVFFLMLLQNTLHHRNKHKVALRRSKTARMRALKRLQILETSSITPTKLTAIFYAYIADKLNVSNKQVTSQSVTTVLSQSVHHADVISQIQSLFSHINSMAYIPEGASYNFVEVVEELSGLLIQLDKTWEYHI